MEERSGHVGRDRQGFGVGLFQKVEHLEWVDDSPRADVVILAQAAEALEDFVAVQAGTVFEHAHQPRGCFVGGDVPSPARDDDSLPGDGNRFDAVDARPHFSLLDMEDFVLVRMDVLEWDKARRFHDPFGDVGLLAGRDTAEGLAGDGVVEGLGKVNGHGGGYQWTVISGQLSVISNQ